MALKCGVIKDVFPTIDFDIHADIDASYAILRKFVKNGPLVNPLSFFDDSFRKSYN